MAASMVDRRHVGAVEAAIESQVLVEQLGRLDGAQDIRRQRAEQLLGEASRELATIAKLDHLEDEARAKLGATLRELAGLIDGVAIQG